MTFKTDFLANEPKYPDSGFEKPQVSPFGTGIAKYLRSKQDTSTVNAFQAIELGVQEFRSDVQLSPSEVKEKYPNIGKDIIFKLLKLWERKGSKLENPMTPVFFESMAIKTHTVSPGFTRRPWAP